MNKLVLIFVFCCIKMSGQNDADIDLLFNQFNNYGNTFYPYVLKSQSDGKILVGGSFTHFNGTTVNRFCRLNLDGSLESVFGTGFNNAVVSIGIQTDGKILAGGNFTTFNNTNTNSLVRINPSGSIDNSFTPPLFNSSVLAIAIQNDGKILLGGGFDDYIGSTPNKLVRLNQNGSIDSSFNIGNGFTGDAGGAGVWTVALQSDGKILVGGHFLFFDGVPQNHLTRLNQDGSKDTSFNIGTGFNWNGENITSIIVQSDGKILVSGDFTTYDGLTQNRLIRLNQDGTRDDSFNIGLGFNGVVRCLTLQNDDKILVSGSFNTFNGLTQSGLIRLNNDGSKDNTFNIGLGFNDGTRPILIQNDGKILVGGTFAQYQGANSYRFVRLKGNSILSTNNFTKNKLTLYPNPTQNILNLTFPETNTATSYEINNVLGEKVSYGNLSSNSISVENLANGVYIIKVKTNEGVLTSKFIKE